jgi:hypothetical protein
MKFYEHLQDRGLKPWHRCWVDPLTEVVTFPLWAANRLVGYQRYNYRGTKKARSNELVEQAKYFTWISEFYRGGAVSGPDNLFGSGPLFIVEGIWDSISIGNVWFDAIAVLTATPSKELRSYIGYLAGNRPVVAVCDNDETGSKLARAADLVVKLPKEYHDANETPEDILRETLLTWKRSPL